MNAVTASDLEAADLLALARLDDDGAPCPSGLHSHSQAAPARTMIAAAPPRIRARCAPPGPSLPT